MRTELSLEISSSEGPYRLCAVSLFKDRISEAQKDEVSAPVLSTSNWPSLVLNTYLSHYDFLLVNC